RHDHPEPDVLPRQLRARPGRPGQRQAARPPRSREARQSAGRGATMTKVYVPQDSAARSVGADLVAAALLRETDEITLVRNGSRGMLWLEPFVEVETEHGRVGYGPVTPQAVPELIAAGMLTGAGHELRQGPVDE